MIKHENDLINQRLSWLFAAQAFLFAAFIVGVRTVVDPQLSDAFDHIITILFLLPIICVGLFSALTAFRMVRDANKQREFAARFWYCRSSKLLGLEEQKKDPEEDKAFKEAILNSGLPTRVHGKNLGTDDFGPLSKLPGAERFTRDHTFLKIMSYAWVVIVILCSALFLKSLCL